MVGIRVRHDRAVTGGYGEKLERVAQIVAVIAIESVGAVVDGELGAETDVDAVSVR